MCADIRNLLVRPACTLIAVAGLLTLGVSPALAGQPAATIDQLRNGGCLDRWGGEYHGRYENGDPVCPETPSGDSDVYFQNGNLGPQNTHLTEGWSVPYRAILINLEDQIGQTIWIEVGFDIVKNEKQALDYITHYDRLDPYHFETFGHDPEAINPLQFVQDEFPGADPNEPDDTVDITPPIWGMDVTCLTPVKNQPGASFGELVDAEGTQQIAIWGGEFVPPGFEYTQAGDPATEASESEARFKVHFRPEQATVVIAWGGHIASRIDWGCPPPGEIESAGDISGSPYHMRLLDWPLGTIGNQDRSLKASAVIVPPPQCDCDPNTTCPSPQQICEGQSATCCVVGVGGVPPYTYKWFRVNPVGDDVLVQEGSEPCLVTDDSIAPLPAEGCATYTFYAIVVDSRGVESEEYPDTTCKFDVQVCLAPTVTLTEPQCVCATQVGGDDTTTCFLVEGWAENVGEGDPTWAAAPPFIDGCPIEINPTADPYVVEVCLLAGCYGTAGVQLTVPGLLSDVPPCDSATATTTITVNPNPSCSFPAQPTIEQIDDDPGPPRVVTLETYGTVSNGNGPYTCSAEITADGIGWEIVECTVDDSTIIVTFTITDQDPSTPEYMDAQTSATFTVDVVDENDPPCPDCVTSCETTLVVQVACDVYPTFPEEICDGDPVPECYVAEVTQGADEHNRLDWFGPFPGIGTCPEGRPPIAEAIKSDPNVPLGGQLPLCVGEDVPIPGVGEWTYCAYAEHGDTGHVSPPCYGVLVVDARPWAEVDDQARCAERSADEQQCALPTSFDVLGSGGNGVPTWELISGPDCLTEADWAVDSLDPWLIHVTFPAECYGTAEFLLTVTGDPEPSDACPPAYAVATLTVFPNPPCEITGGQDEICADGETTTWTGPAGMDAYEWTLDDAVVGTGQDLTIGPLPAGEYTYCLLVTMEYTLGDETYICVCRCCRTLTVVPCNEACSPGYWRHEQHYGSWYEAGYDPMDNFCEAFVIPAADCDDYGVGALTLIAAVNMSGGSFNQALFHGTAALLNAAHPDVDFPASVEGVQLVMQRAFAGEITFADAHGQFAAWNSVESEGGCPLNGGGSSGGTLEAPVPGP